MTTLTEDIKVCNPKHVSNRDLKKNETLTQNLAITPPSFNLIKLFSVVSNLAKQSRVFATGKHFRHSPILDGSHGTSMNWVYKLNLKHLASLNVAAREQQSSLIYKCVNRAP
jgi:hypothetical protein